MTLNELCKKKGLTHRELAEKSGLNLNTIDFLASGRLDIHKAKYETLEKLAKALKVNIKDLL